MALSDVTKQELKTHMNIELGRKGLISAEQIELETHMNIELGRNRLTPMEPHMELKLSSLYSVISYYTSD